jgi:ribosomal protein L37AE/L43A
VRTAREIIGKNMTTEKLKEIVRVCGIEFTKFDIPAIWRQPEKIYWIKNNTGGAMGSWDTPEGAKSAIKGLKAMGNDLEWEVEAHEVGICPTCGEKAEKDIIEGLGECLRCDHIRGDLL